MNRHANTLMASQAMQRLGVDAEVLEMLIDRGEIETTTKGGEHVIPSDSIVLYERRRKDQARTLDELVELTEELSMLGVTGL